MPVQEPEVPVAEELESATGLNVCQQREVSFSLTESKIGSAGLAPETVVEKELSHE